MTTSNMGGIDFSQYMSWRKVTAPTGAVYYAVPGTGYVYDPFLSASKGRPVLWTNPQPSVDEKKKIEDERQAQIDLVKRQSSPVGQLLPVVGAAGGTIGAKYAIDALGPATNVAKLEEAKAAAELAKLSGTSQAVTPAAEAFTQGAGLASQGGAVPIQSLANGGVLMSDGSVTTASALESTGSAPVAAGAPVSTLSQGLGALGVAAGAYGAYKGFEDKNPLTAGMGGAGIGLGLNSLGYALGPWGWAASLAIPAGLALANKLGDKDMWKTERDRLNKLKEGGAFIPDSILETMPSRGRTKEELVAFEQAKQDAGQWANTEFAGSRNESALKPQDIWGYSAFAEKDPQWFARSEAERLATAQRVLDAGAVQEHHGTIDIDWSKVGDPTAEVQPTTPPGTAPVQTRSSTLSPGIGLDGQRIGQQLSQRMNRRR